MLNDKLEAAEERADNNWAGLKRVRQRVAELEAETARLRNPWISVSEQMPTLGEANDVGYRVSRPVLTFRPNVQEGQTVAYRWEQQRLRDGCWRDHSTGRILFGEVTHWAHLLDEPPSVAGLTALPEDPAPQAGQRSITSEQMEAGRPVPEGHPDEATDRSEAKTADHQH